MLLLLLLLLLLSRHLRRVYKERVDSHCHRPYHQHGCLINNIHQLLDCAAKAL